MDDKAERIVKLSYLTPRQREVLELIGQNLKSGDIAQRLSIKERTVTAHIVEIYGRLGISEPDQDGKVGRNVRQRELASYAHALRFLAQGKMSQDQSLLARSSVRDEQANIDDEELVTEGLISTQEDEPPVEVLAIIRVVGAVIEDGYGFTKQNPILFLSRRTWLLLLLAGNFLLFIFITIAIISGITADDVNIAPQATVTASSYLVDAKYFPDCFIPRNAVDNNRLDHGRCVEWVSNNDKEGVWIKLEFDTVRKISKIILYDRPNLDDNILHGTLEFGDDTGRIINRIAVPGLRNDGVPTEIDLQKSLNIKWVRFTVDDYVGPFVGLSEIQIIR